MGQIRDIPLNPGQVATLSQTCNLIHSRLLLFVCTCMLYPNLVLQSLPASSQVLLYDVHIFGQTSTEVGRGRSLILRRAHSRRVLHCQQD